jgi:beta-galactosidase
MGIPNPLPPAIPQLDVTVSEVDSLRPDCPTPLATGGHVINYRDVVVGGATPVLTTTNGDPVAMRTGTQTYLGGWLDEAALQVFLREACNTAGITTIDLPDGVRIRDTGSERFWFNYNADAVTCHGHTIAAAGVIRETR